MAERCARSIDFVSMNSFQIKLRTLARKSGLIRVVNRMRPARPYEYRFHQALVAAVREGDVVWDVGANVGPYTELFCQWTGPGGLVVAFEPGMESLAKIPSAFPAAPGCASRTRRSRIRTRSGDWCLRRIR